MPHVLQRALDPRAAPRWILLRHPYHEAPDFGDHAATTRPAGVRPLPGDELTMPPQQRFGCHDRGDLTQRPTAHTEGAYHEAAPFLIGQAQTPRAQLPPEQAVL